MEEPTRDSTQCRALVLYKESEGDRIRRDIEEACFKRLFFESGYLVHSSVKRMHRYYQVQCIGNTGIILRSEIFSDGLTSRLNSKGKISERRMFDFAKDGETFLYCNADKKRIEVRVSDDPEYMLKCIPVLLPKDHSFLSITTTENPKHALLETAEQVKGEKSAYTKPQVFCVNIETGEITPIVDNELPFASVEYIYSKNPNIILVEFSGQKESQPYRYKWVIFNLENKTCEELATFSTSPGDIVFDENENPTFTILKSKYGEQTVFKVKREIGFPVTLVPVYREGKSMGRFRRIQDVDQKTGDIYIASRLGLEYWTPVKRTQKGPFVGEEPLLPNYLDQANVKNFGVARKKGLQEGLGFRIFQNGRQVIKLSSKHGKLSGLNQHLEEVQDAIWQQSGGELSIESGSCLDLFLEKGEFTVAAREENAKGARGYHIWKIKVPEEQNESQGSITLSYKTFNPFTPLPFSAKFSDTHSFEIPTHDGMTMPAFMTGRNAKKGKSPLLLLVHGGPHAKDKGTRLDLMVQYIASYGIQVLQVNYPGSTGGSRTFEEFSDGRWDKVPAYLMEALEWAVKKNIDPKRIVVGGISFGATIAANMVARYPEWVRGAIAINGTYDYVKTVEEAAGYMDGSNYVKSIHDWEDTVLQLGGDPRIPKQKKILYQKSVYPHLENVEGWTLLFSGLKDNNCIPRQSLDLAKALHGKGKRVQYVSFKGMGDSLENVDEGGRFDSHPWEVVAAMSMRAIGKTFGIPYEPMEEDFWESAQARGAKLEVSSKRDLVD